MIRTRRRSVGSDGDGSYCMYSLALGAARLSLRIATTASTRCRGGHVRDPMNMPRDSGVYSTLIKSKKPLQYPYHCTTVPGTYRRGGAGAERADSINNRVPG